MGLSDEGLVLVLVFTWLPLLALHGVVMHRALRMTRSGVLSDYNKNLVALVTFVLVAAIYTTACTVSIYAALVDRETDRSLIALIAESVWLISPVVAAACALIIDWPPVVSGFKIFPSSRPEWKLAVSRAIFFGVPFCFIFAAGDQVLRNIIGLLVTGDYNSPVPIRPDFVVAIGTAFGYSGGNPFICHIIGGISNFTIGPLIDLFAPACDSIYEYKNAAGTGIASYFLYAIPEEIGWTGTLYPLLVRHFAEQGRAQWAVLKSILLTGVVWGLWHVPFIVLKADPDSPTYIGIVYNFLFLLSCVATRAVLIPLVWPVHRPSTHLLEGEAETITKPSLVPAIMAHAGMNVWWTYFSALHDWKAAPVWSMLVGSEFGLVAVAWQFAIAFIVIRSSWKSAN